MMTLDDTQISNILFHPRKEEWGYTPEGIPTVTVSGRDNIGGYLHLHPTSETLLIFFHGNGEIAADYDEIASYFTSCGVSFWIVDYRGYGRSSGSPAYHYMFEDAESILNDIPRLAQTVGRTFDRILVMGRSLGSASALYLASRHAQRLSGLLLDSPYADGLKMIYRLSGLIVRKDEVAGFVDNIDFVSTVTLPTLILHGTIDQIIPLSDARALIDACANPGKILVPIEGAGHNDLMFRAGMRYWESIRIWIESLPR